jgi:hypothetical protein
MASLLMTPATGPALIGTEVSADLDFETGGNTTWALGTDRNWKPLTDNVFNLGTSSLRPAIVYGVRHLAGAGTLAAPSIAFDNDTDTGLYSVGDGDIGLVSNGAVAAIATDAGAGGVVVVGAVMNGLAQSVVDVTGSHFYGKGGGSCTTPDFSTIIGGSENTGMTVNAGDRIDVCADGADELIIDPTGVVGSQVTSGTVHSWRIPTGMANTVPSKPACSASTDVGRMILLDDTNDTAGADVCVCGKWADDTTFSWASTMHHDVATGNPSACAL